VRLDDIEMKFDLDSIPTVEYVQKNMKASLAIMGAATAEIHA
jgi:hypothetical protein